MQPEHVSGVATQTALSFLTHYSVGLRDDRWVANEQADHVLFVRDQAAAEFKRLRSQLEQARGLACRYEAELQRLESLHHAIVDAT